MHRPALASSSAVQWGNSDVVARYVPPTCLRQVSCFYVFKRLQFISFNVLLLLPFMFDCMMWCAYYTDLLYLFWCYVILNRLRGLSATPRYISLLLVLTSLRLCLSCAPKLARAMF